MFYTDKLLFLPGQKKGIRGRATYGNSGLVFVTKQKEYDITNATLFAEGTTKYDDLFGYVEKDKEHNPIAYSYEYLSKVTITNYGDENELIRIQMEFDKSILLYKNFTKIPGDKKTWVQYVLNVKTGKCYKFSDITLKYNENFKYSNNTIRGVNNSLFYRHDRFNEFPDTIITYIEKIAKNYYKKKFGFEPSFYNAAELDNNWEYLYSIVKNPLNNTLASMLKYVSNKTFRRLFYDKVDATNTFFDYIKVKQTKSLNKLLFSEGVTAVLTYKALKASKKIKKEDNLIKLSADMSKLLSRRFEGLGKIIRGNFYTIDYQLIFGQSKNGYKRDDECSNNEVLTEFYKMFDLYKDDDENIGINKYINADKRFLTDSMRMYQHIENCYTGEDKAEILRKVKRSKWDKDIHDYLTAMDRKILQGFISFEDQVEEYKRFEFSNDNYQLKVAKTNYEIIDVGVKMHICVGSAFYTEQVIDGTSVIFVVYNKAGSPITCIEYIVKDKKLLQVKGICNRLLVKGTPEREFVNAWIRKNKINPVCDDLV